MKTLIVSTMTVLSLAGVAHANTSGDDIRQVKYACAGNEVLDTVFINTKAGNSFAIITQANELIPMAITPMASGASYVPIDADYTYRLDTKGDTATLVTVDGGKDTVVLSDCTAAN